MTIDILELRRHPVSSNSLTIFISILADLLAVGSLDNWPHFAGNVKTEIYQIAIGSWKPLPDYSNDKESKMILSSIFDSWCPVILDTRS